VAVYTQPDKPVGRKRIMTSPEVKTLALEQNIEVYQPNRLRDEEVVSKLLTIKCDYIVVAAYGQILPREILDHAPCINLHASILPQYRGASPIQQTLLNDDKQTGETAMLMEEGLDTGDILKIDTMEVPKDMMVETLFDSLTELACALTLEVLQNFKKLTPQKQVETEASHCKKISKQDGLVAFHDAHELYSKYRAFTPWPGVYLENGLKLKKIDLVDKCALGKSGTILRVNKDNILVACDKGVICIYLVQPQSKKEMSVIAYINGKRLGIEDTIS
jgi:methionyl-tRNA formyltransferase